MYDHTSPRKVKGTLEQHTRSLTLSTLYWNPDSERRYIRVELTDTLERSGIGGSADHIVPKAFPIFLWYTGWGAFVY